MNRIALLSLMLLLFAACNNEEKTTTTATTDTVPAAEQQAVTTDSFCYINTTGNKNQDTFALKLFITGEQVTGKLMYLYHEKDWRIGKIEGTKKRNKIKAKWVYMQEGMLDSTNITFKIYDGSIREKAKFYDNVTGREIMSGNDKDEDNDAAYDKEYKQADCASFPAYDFDFGM
jgi:hypothetical protein